MLEAGRGSSSGRSVSEAVAPYVTPQTPRDARPLGRRGPTKRCERDWLHQADGNPTPRADPRGDRLDAASWPSGSRPSFPARVDFSAELAELAELEKQAAVARGRRRGTLLRRSAR